MASMLDDAAVLTATMLKKGHIIPNWKERFIVLSPDKLEYFMDSTKKVRKGELPITDETEIEGRVGSNHEFKFTISTGSKSLTMAASGPEMREEWTQAVRKLVDLKVSSSNLKTLSTATASASAAKPVASGQQTLRRRNKQGCREQAAKSPAEAESPNENYVASKRSEETAASAAQDRATRPVSQPFASSRAAAAPVQEPAPRRAASVKEASPVDNAAVSSRVDNDGWERVDSPEGTYYYHKKTRVSRWDKPDEAISAALNSRLQQTERSADTAFQMRKEQMELEKIAAAEKAQLLDHIKPEVLTLLSSWKESSPGNPNDLMTLINSLPSILPHLHDEVSSGRFAPYLRADASESEVKKAYFRAIRFLHPDKLPASLDLCDKMVAEYAFAYLCEVFQLYREMVADS